jgi:hypothetical protein
LRAIRLAKKRYQDYLKQEGARRAAASSTTTLLAECYPDPADRAAIAAGMQQLRAEQRASRLAEMRRRLGMSPT